MSINLMHPTLLALERDQDGHFLTVRTRDRKPGHPPVPFAGKAFVPEVFHNDAWYPICGPAFWDSDDGATTVCRAFGYYVGKIKRTEEIYNGDAMPVGSCRSGEPLDVCTGGGNAWGDPGGNISFNNGSISCKKGNRIGIQIICTFPAPIIHGVVITVCVMLCIIIITLTVYGSIKYRNRIVARQVARQHYLSVCETEEYQKEVRRQWLRVFDAICTQHFKIPPVAQSDPDMSQLIKFFQSRPGLRTLVGGQMALFYAPPSAIDFTTKP